MIKSSTIFNKIFLNYKIKLKEPNNTTRGTKYQKEKKSNNKKKP
jgi:hypothetical protein